ncbi:hypothetical protein Lyticum_00255 [Lyticum sinuosum]|uniref:Uncharacterized protein n=1 Tax=Lyticum sinuosum TaxID=1332059 RepID=A0AAE4VL28_9RICK|nr:hypothetical protein [Lyticum sinuosum]
MVLHNLYLTNITTNKSNLNNEFTLIKINVQVL